MSLVTPQIIERKWLNVENLSSCQVDVIEKMCTEFMHNLKTSGSFDATGDSKEPVTALLWVYYFLGQHYDKCGEYQKALAIVDEAIDHTPTLIELFLLKGKIFKARQPLNHSVSILNREAYFFPPSACWRS